MRTKEEYKKFMYNYYSVSDCGNVPDFQTTTIRKAIKPRKCCQCGGMINAGELYYHEKGKFDGDFYDIGTCHKCLDKSIDELEG